MNYKSDFLTKNIMTYLGNKRKLLPFINSSIEEIIASDVELSKKQKEAIIVFDIFSGSGIVSRSLKQFGYKVYANDLEIYSKAINQTFIETNEEDLDSIFSGIPEKIMNFYKNNNIQYVKSKNKNDSYQQVVDILNSVRDLGKVQTKPYFSIFYAPKDTKNPNFETERLFYTQENGRFIDAILDAVFEFKDVNGKPIFNEKAKYIILASLFNKMTTNINTSGTMKGFHDGWGGNGGHALERILGDIKLERIRLLNNSPKGKSFNDYAENIFINNPDLFVDIIYADPPYNQHQYSANYHMLTTAMNNRDYQLSETLTTGNRAGIRKDHNRSDFSKSKKVAKKSTGENISEAYLAFDKFIKNTMNKTKYILISYNQEGVLSQDELIEILSQGGVNKISIKTQKHEKFKGGKKTNISNYVVEYLFIVETNVAQNEEEIKKLKNETTSQTKIKLLNDKYVDLEKALIAGYDIEKSTNSYILSLGDINIKLSKDFKIEVFSQENVLDSDLLAIEQVCYGDMDKEKLLKDYISKHNYSAAIKVLQSFKIEKYKDIFNYYINLLDGEQLSEKEKKSLNKMKK